MTEYIQTFSGQVPIEKSSNDKDPMQVTHMTLVMAGKKLF